jgi:hypothetical protein
MAVADRDASRRWHGDRQRNERAMDRARFNAENDLLLRIERASLCILNGARRDFARLRHSGDQHRSPLRHSGDQQRVRNFYIAKKSPWVSEVNESRESIFYHVQSKTVNHQQRLVNLALQ